MKTIEEVLDMIDFFYTHKRFCERLKRQEQRKEKENHVHVFCSCSSVGSSM